MKRKKEKWHSDIEYKEFGIQGETGEEVDREKYRTICSRGSDIKKCSKIEAASLYEDLFSSKY